VRSDLDTQIANIIWY